MSVYRDNALQDTDQEDGQMVEFEDIECFFYTKGGEDKYKAQIKFESNFGLFIYNGKEPAQIYGSGARSYLKSFLTNAHKEYGGYLFDDCFIPLNELKEILIVSKKTNKFLKIQHK